MARLGAFRLLGPRGRGGMAEVWEARHDRTGLGVAVKVIGASAEADPRRRDALDREVQAMARLSHPWIVRVFDHGTVPTEAPEAPEGLVPGAPWFAMEWVPSTLDAHVGRLGWAPVRRILSRLLDALAHAHARGVLHRDVKPANVLVASDATWQIRLADFGIAHARGEEAAPLTAGTPAFMAPEQREGRWRRQGPWTDLYAVGKLAQVLLDPEAAVPRGWQGWLAAMCARDSWERPTFAAHARDLLLALGPGEAPVEGTRRPTSKAPEPAFDATWFDDVDGALEDATLGEVPITDERAPTTSRGWRDTHLPDDGALADAGLGLCHVREPRFVGRVEQRDRLWAHLLEVVRAGAPRVVTVRGPEGAGSTRLGDWLADRAHELGLAWSYRARPPGVMAAVAAEALGVRGLAGAERAALCAEVTARHGWVGPGVGRSLAALVGGEMATADAVALGLRLLGLVSRRAPLVVVVDEAGEGDEERALAAEIASRPELGPVLVVLVVRSDEPARPGDVALPPLPPADLEVLLDEVVPLAPELRQQVVAWAGGLPGAAVDRVRAWALAGRLRPGADGYRLDGAPDPDADGPWASRLQAFLATRAPAEVEAVELGACLGELRDDEWRRACTLRGVDAHALGAALLRVGLVRATGDGATFAHRSLAPRLVARAAAEGRVADAHRACAAVLAELGADPGRIGTHLLEAGDAEAALPALAAGAKVALARAAMVRTRSLIEAWERAAALAGVRPDELRATVPVLLRLGVAQSDLSDVPGAEAVARDLERRARANGWTAHVFGAAAVLGRLASLTGRLDAAVGHLERAREAALSLGDPVRAARCDHELGVVAARRGRHEQALELLGRALVVYAPLDPHLRETIESYLAHSLACLGRLDEAGALVARHADPVEPFAENWLLLRGEIARRRGDLDEAERHYRHGAELAAAAGRRQQRLACQGNLGLCAIGRGRYEAAQVVLEDVLAGYERAGARHLEGAVHVLLLACAAATGDAASWSHHLAAAEALLGSTGYRDVDVAEGLERAIALAPEAGRSDDVPRLRGLLADQRA